jgi:glucose/arabinose dehydrogenase
MASENRRTLGMDNGMDGLANNDPPEELNHIENGKRYGWPCVYADKSQIRTWIRRAAVASRPARTDTPRHRPVATDFCRHSSLRG